MARLFLSTDDDAPVIAGNDRTCVVNLLKKCLVEGYGDKAPAGWTMPYSSADGRVGVFRNDFEGGGLGHYLRVAQENDVANYSHQWTLAAYENMTDENTGVFPYLGSPFNFDTGGTSAVIRPWIMLAAKTWMALFIYSNKTSASAFPGKADEANTSQWITSGWWWGDIEKWLPDDNHHSMLSPISQNRFCSTTASSSSTGVGGYVFARSSDGVAGSSYSANAFLPHPLSGGSLGGDGPAYDAASGLLAARVAFGDSGAYTLRGWLPDAIAPLHPRPFDNLERVDIDGKTYVAVCFRPAINNTGRQYSCQLLFALDEGE